MAKRLRDKIASGFGARTSEPNFPWFPYSIKELDNNMTYFIVLLWGLNEFVYIPFSFALQI